MEWNKGEFLCPLCECYGNTVLPLLPQVGQLSVGAEPVLPTMEITMLEWKKLLLLAVELGSGNAMDIGQYLRQRVEFVLLHIRQCVFPMVVLRDHSG